MTVRHIQTYCAMCISRCGVIATVDDDVFIKVSPDPEHPNGCICVKGSAAPEIVYAPDRLRYPMLRTRPKGDRDPGWRRISWGEAMDLLVARILHIGEQYGPEAMVFGYATPRGTATSDFSLWVQRLANAFTTPNILNSVHTCHWSREYGSRYTFGTASPFPGAGFAFPDYDEARCILLWGFNPQASWPGAALRINQAKARGASLIIIDPRAASSVTKADVWLRVRPGRDGTLALAMIHVLLEERLYDEAFVREWTNAPFLVREDTGELLTELDLLPSGGLDTFFIWDEHSGRTVSYHRDHGYAHHGVVPALAGTYTVTLADGTPVATRPAFELLRELVSQYAPERSEKTTWVAAGDVRQAVRTFAHEKPSCYFTWAGLEQHNNAAQVNRAVCIFYALTGQFDRPGSNVLFAATPTNPIAGRHLLPEDQAVKRLGRAERPLGAAAAPGFVQAYNVSRAILTGEPYPVRGLMMFGSDYLLANGDPLRGKAALEVLDFYVHMDMFLNPSASMADLLLPAATCWEREGLMPSFDVARDTVTWAQFRAAVVQPLFESRPELDVVFELAARLGLGEHFFHGDIEAALDYHLAPSGITVRALREHPMGIRVDARTRYRKYAERDHTGQPRGFATPTRKIEIYSTTFARAGHPALPVCEDHVETRSRPADVSAAYPLVLTSFRVVQFCDAAHRNIPRLRRQVPEPFVEVHPSTASALSIQNGEWVIVETPAGHITLKARLNPRLHPSVVCTQYGWWQGCTELQLPGYDPFTPGGANSNFLVSSATGAIDPISGSVAQRSQICRLRKQEASSVT